MKQFILILLLIIFHLLLIKAENSDNNTINKTNCDSNEDETFFFHENFNDCILNECQEYPEISPGCIICKNHLSEYKKNKTCQRCKYGYFKTKNGKCIYCASEKYGGSACRGCTYQKDENGLDTDNIICKDCPMQNDSFNDFSYYFALSPAGKCFLHYFYFPCIKHSYENYLKENKCDICWEGFYKTSEGYCVGYSSLVKRIPHCSEYNFTIKNIQLNLEFDYQFELVYIISGQENNDIIISEFFKDGIKEEIESTCFKCDYGYISINEGKCRELKLEDCSFNSIINNYRKLYLDVKNFAMIIIWL